MIRIFEYNLYQVAQTSPKNKDSEAAEKPDKSDSQAAASDNKQVDLPKLVGDLKVFEQVSPEDKIKELQRAF